MANLKNTVISDTVFRLPVGDTAARPTGTNGAQLRFSTETGQLEQFRPGLGAWIAPSNTGVIATGGDAVYDVETEGTTYRVHVFTSTGTSTFSVLQGGEVEYLIVAGGGGGSGGFQSPGGGGGGAGGLLQGTTTVSPQNYNITVGAGGSFGTGDTNGSGFVDATNGGDSSLFGLTAIGGGKGGSYSGVASGSGGSAGGEAYGGGLGSPTAGQGNAGGSAEQNSVQNAGGGGGAGGPGQPGGTAPDSPAGDGGIGLQSNITGTSTYYAGGGGGGGGYNSAGGGSTVDGGEGGLGGGGDGGSGATDNVSLLTGDPGTPNTGGGGGGAGGPDGSQDNTNQDGGDGGSGIVVVRYPLRQNNPETAAGQDVNNGLVLDLDFAKPTVYSGSGSAVTDSRLNGIEGDINGASFVNPRTHRSAFEFDGSNDRIGDSSFFLNSDPLVTVVMWIRRTGSFSNGGYWGLGGGGTGNGINGYTGSSSNKIAWDLWGQTTLDTGEEYPLEQWINVAWVKFAAGFSTSTLTCYINGVEFPLINTQRNRSTTVNLTTGFSIGVISTNVNNYYAPGDIGQTLLYNRALTQTELSNIFESTRWRFGV